MKKLFPPFFIDKYMFQFQLPPCGFLMHVFLFSKSPFSKYSLIARHIEWIFKSFKQWITVTYLMQFIYLNMDIIYGMCNSCYNGHVITLVTWCPNGISEFFLITLQYQFDTCTHHSERFWPFHIHDDSLV